MRALAAACAVLALAGCWPEEDRYDAGHGDGYAVGYNTTCGFPRNFIHAEWDNASYSRGYADGMADGAADCLADRQN